MTYPTTRQAVEDRFRAILTGPLRKFLDKRPDIYLRRLIYSKLPMWAYMYWELANDWGDIPGIEEWEEKYGKLNPANYSKFISQAVEAGKAVPRHVLLQFQKGDPQDAAQLQPYGNLPGLYLSPYQLTLEEWLGGAGSGKDGEARWVEAIRAAKQNRIPLHTDVERSWEIYQTRPKSDDVIAQLPYLMNAEKKYQGEEREAGYYHGKIHDLIIKHFKDEYKLSMGDGWVKRTDMEKNKLFWEIRDSLAGRAGVPAHMLPAPDTSILEAWKKMDQGAKAGDAKKERAKVAAKFPEYETRRAELKQALVEWRKADYAVTRTETFRHIGGLARIGLSEGVRYHRIEADLQRMEKETLGYALTPHRAYL